MKNLTIYILIILCISLAIYSQRSIPAPQTPCSGRTAQIRPMSIADTQRLLIKLGFADTIKGRLTVDGKWGVITEQAMCDYHASPHFPKQEIPKNLEKL